MTTLPDWLPPLIELKDYDGNWNSYIEAVFACFYKDFIDSQPKYQNKWIRCRRDLLDGKEAAFWHCISEGAEESSRIPDLRRCERIEWIRAIIEHPDNEHVDVWDSKKHGDKRCLLWFMEKFLVVLSYRKRKKDGFEYMQLITAYSTSEEHRKRNLRKERDEYKLSKNS